MLGLSLHCRHLSSTQVRIKTSEVRLINDEVYPFLVDSELTSTLILSHFDDVIGPEVLYSTQDLNNPKIMRLIPNLIDITQGKILEVDPFVFAASGFQSRNIIFSIPEVDSRGGKKEYLLSFVLTPDTQIGFMAIIGLETFFLSCSEEFKILFNKCHKEMEGTVISKSSLLASPTFERIKRKMIDYHEEVLNFVLQFIN